MVRKGQMARHMPYFLAYFIGLWCFEWDGGEVHCEEETVFVKIQSEP